MALTIPDSVESWKAKVREHKLDRPEVQLSRINDRALRPNILRSPKTKLSGSTMREDDFLFLRAIWTGFGDGADLTSAAALSSARAVLEKLGRVDSYSHALACRKLRLDPTTLYPSSESHRGLEDEPKGSRSKTDAPLPPETPPRPQAQPVDDPGESHKERDRTVGSGNPMIAWFRKFISLCDKHCTQREFDAMGLGTFFSTYDTFVGLVGFDDIEQPNSEPQTPPGGAPTDLSRYCGFITDDTPSRKRPRVDSQSRQADEESSSAMEQDHDSELDPDAGASEVFALDETYVTTFATNLFSSVSILLNSGGHQHRMEPIRMMFGCGSWNADPAATKSLYFNAVIDAVVRTKTTSPLASGNFSHVSSQILFLSEFKRKKYEYLKGTVEIQETAEAAAFFAAREAIAAATPEETPAWGTKRSGSLVMLCQYCLDISIIVAEYGPEWLDYVQHSDRPVDSDDISAKHMLRMRRIGIYEEDNPEHMRWFSYILASMLLKDSRGLSASTPLDLLPRE